MITKFLFLMAACVLCAQCAADFKHTFEEVQVEVELSGKQYNYVVPWFPRCKPVLEQVKQDLDAQLKDREHKLRIPDLEARLELARNRYNKARSRLMHGHCIDMSCDGGHWCAECGGTGIPKGTEMICVLCGKAGMFFRMPDGKCAKCKREWTEEHPELLECFEAYIDDSTAMPYDRYQQMEAELMGKYNEEVTNELRRIEADLKAAKKQRDNQMAEVKEHGSYEHGSYFDAYVKVSKEVFKSVEDLPKLFDMLKGELMATRKNIPRLERSFLYGQLQALKEMIEKGIYEGPKEH